MVDYIDLFEKRKKSLIQYCAKIEYLKILQQ